MNIERPQVLVDGRKHLSQKKNHISIPETKVNVQGYFFLRQVRTWMINK